MFISMLSELSQTQKGKDHMIIFTREILNH